MFYLNNETGCQQFAFLASVKLEINGSTLVLEKDGTEVSDSDILLYLKEETFILLQPGETWKSPVSEETESTKSTVTNSSLNSSILSWSASDSNDNLITRAYDIHNVQIDTAPNTQVSY